MAVSPSWTEDHVRRLFWRAGCGATPRDARRWTARGQDAAIAWLLDGDGRELRGPDPRVDGRPIDPLNEFGHDALWWLDRMVRSMRPLVEKMTLFWHDHFACKEQTPLMLQQNRAMRGLALGDFRALLRAMTLDPAMQRFLSLAGSNRKKPNENFARELFELFTLGGGYSEDDIREASRALTGFRAPRDPRTRLPTVVYEERRHDPGVKTIFGRSGRFTWEDVLELAVTQPAHPGFIVDKRWSFVVTEPLDPGTRAALEGAYTSSNLQIRPVVEAILRHPALYARLEAPALVKCPAVFVAGWLRTTGRPVDRNWSFLMGEMGQRLFEPPSVAGWDWGAAWLSTNAMRARFAFAGQLMGRGPTAVPDGSAPRRVEARAAVDSARRAVGLPWTSKRTDKLLRRMVNDWDSPRRRPPKGRPGPPMDQERADMLQRSLRHLLVSGPDAQLH